MFEATIVLATILQHCRMELPANHVPPKIEAQISLHPKGGMPLVFADRPK
jgi:cytochrome P450